MFKILPPNIFMVSSTLTLLFRILPTRDHVCVTHQMIHGQWIMLMIFTILATLFKVKVQVSNFLFELVVEEYSILTEICKKRLILNMIIYYHFHLRKYEHRKISFLIWIINFFIVKHIITLHYAIVEKHIFPWFHEITKCMMHWENTQKIKQM